jgi:iron complex outermembrane receptor protein
MRHGTKGISTLAIATALLATPSVVWAQAAGAAGGASIPEGGTQNGGVRPAVAADNGAQETTADATHAASAGFEEVVVTARRRSENLQRVPDAITAFTADSIANANITNVADISRLTPGLNFRDGRAFSANFFDIRMRGIGSAQGGWPSVSIIVDGVPNDSGDALTAGSLAGVERIEVLRGPQSALYGAGAIAGAINIVTKRPTDTFEGEGRLYYGNGNDLQAGVAVSGPLIPGKLLFRLSGNYRNDDGRIDSTTNGAHLDPHDRKQIDGRLLVLPTENFEADLRAGYNKEENGYAFQARVGTTGNLNDLINTDNPVFARRTGDSAGRQERTFTRLSARLNWELEGVTLTSVAAYTRTRQDGIGTACYDDVDFPQFPQPGGGELCLSNTLAFGSNAAPGQVIERFQTASDDLDSYFGDFRVASSNDGPINWLVGASGMRRKVFSVLSGFNTVAGTANRPVTSLTVNQKRDEWWGVYAQIGAELGKFELTANARYDDQTYKNTTFADATRRVIIQKRDAAGNLVDTLKETARNFQPKGQISYHLDSDKTAYFTVSRGFRAGYFNAGSYAIPEHTWNYEVGLKTAWLERRVIANIAAFKIDYSNQQLSQVTNTPPFRVPVVIPQTTIKGIELETSVRPVPVFSLSGNLTYLDAVVSDGTRSPKAPRWSGAISGQLDQPFTDTWTLNAHADWSFHSSQYLFTANTQRVPSKGYVNARIGLERDNWGIYFVAKNLTNTEEPQLQTGTATPYRVVYPVDPRSYGVELHATF